ncbi:leucine-rich repeat flightless-interacting protein 1 isoform X10 [Lithobates pipiens]
MGTQGTGRKRHPNRERLSAEDHALNQIAREAEARLAAKRAARAEAREIRMKELERQQKEIYQVQKKYYGLDAKWGDIEQWMEDSERYSHRPRRNLQVSDDDDLMSVTSRSSLRTNGYEDELLGPSQYRKSSRSSTGSGETFQSSRGARKDEPMSAYYSDLSLASASLSKQQQSVHNGSRPSLLNCNSLPSRSQRGSLYEEGVNNSSRRSSSSRPPSEYSCYPGSGSRASSRASSARASPVSSEPPGPSVVRRGSNSASIPSLNHSDDVSIPAMSRVEERSDKDFGEKGSRPVSSLSAATLASLGGTSSRRGSGDTSISVDTEASIREIKDSLAEVEEKYKRSMVTNAQLDNEKTSLQYQVDTLREVLLEFEEELAESRRQYEDKHKECERQKHDQNILHFKLAEMKEALEQRESLLTEIRQLQQKQENGDREICDLKETIEWKDKKIGALERQKDFFEPVRSERDALREEVTRLRDELKKHGIALDSVGTPNGDASVEPHVNADGRPDPPIRATSMGPSEEAVEKKETMSVVGEIPPSKTEQANQEVLLTASSESPLNAEVGDEMKEQIIQEFAHNSNDVNTVGTVSGCQTDLEHHGALSFDSASTSNERENAVDEHAPENVHKENLELRFSEMPKETTVDQRNTSPVENDVFQDALENVVQSPLVADQFSEEYAVSSGDFRSDDYNFSQQDLNKEEDQCIQSTSIESNSVPKNGTLEISDCKDNVVFITDDVGDLHKDTKDEHETSISDDSSKDDSEGSTADEMTATAVKHEVCEEEVKHEEQSVLVESGLESREDDSEKKDSNTNISSEESVSAEAIVHTDACDVAEKKTTDESPEQSTQDIQLIKEDKQLVDRENNNYGEVSEPCVISNMQSAVKNEVLKKIEDDSISHLDQHKGKTDDGRIHANLGSQKNGKINTAFPDIPGPELLDKREENTFSDTLVYDESERSNKKMNTIFSDAPDTVVLDEGNLDKISDHPVCDKSETINEITNPVFPDVPGTELLEEEKQDKTSDHPDGSSSSENTIDNIPVVTETQKDSVSSETVSSEGECTPEGEESDDNEDVAVRSEKYTGESLPLGSSVDHGSTDDIRMEDSSDKAVRKGKGKNKEDCVVS